MRQVCYHTGFFVCCCNYCCSKGVILCHTLLNQYFPLKILSNTDVDHDYLRLNLGYIIVSCLLIIKLQNYLRWIHKTLLPSQYHSRTVSTMLNKLSYFSRLPRAKRRIFCLRQLSPLSQPRPPRSKVFVRDFFAGGRGQKMRLNATAVPRASLLHLDPKLQWFKLASEKFVKMLIVM